jgi:hypothetical protein
VGGWVDKEGKCGSGGLEEPVLLKFGPSNTAATTKKNKKKKGFDLEILIHSTTAGRIIDQRRNAP